MSKFPKASNRFRKSGLHKRLVWNVRNVAYSFMVALLQSPLSKRVLYLYQTINNSLHLIKWIFINSISVHYSHHRGTRSLCSVDWFLFEITQNYEVFDLFSIFFSLKNSTLITVIFYFSVFLSELFIYIKRTITIHFIKGKFLMCISFCFFRTLQMVKKFLDKEKKV